MVFRARVPFKSVIDRQNIASGLQLCLDAGDINSWPGSGQKWLDVSGNGYDFHLGTTSGSEATDPAFTGTAGALTSGDYWTCDADALFTYDTTNETWMQNLHKDGAIFTMLAWVYQTAYGVGGSPCVFGTLGNATKAVGIQFQLNQTTGLLRLQFGNGSANFSFTSGGAAPSLNAWHLIGVSVSENAGASGGQFYSDGAVNGAAFNPAYTSPSAANATFTMQVAGAGNSQRPVGMSGDARMGFFGIWEGVNLTAAQILAFYNSTESFFPPRSRPNRFYKQRF